MHNNGLNLDLPIDRSDDSSVAADSSSRGGYDRFRRWIPILLFSIALLIPCFWQSRIQAADLSSHIYNAWLASQIRRGSAPGLWISFQSNNILFDLMLQWLVVRVGPDLAQRLAVSASVLVFGWGALLFIFRVAGEHWWFAAPCVLMLAYGFVFHMGLFNFYLSMGVCLWYLAIFWKRSWRIRAAAAPLLILAWLAHPFPVAWAAGIAAYIACVERVRPQQRLWFLAPGLAALAIARYILVHRYTHDWSPEQAFSVTGANQLVLFGLKYIMPFMGLLLLWLTWLAKLAKRLGIANLLLTIPFQLWLLNATAVLLIPDRLIFPIGFITARLSLGAALMLCATLAAAPASNFERVALVAVTVMFFCLLYADDRALNHLEDRLDAALAQLPRAQRVVTRLGSQSLRSLCLYHQLDRACIARCFSYANYEASSQRFLVRARRGNGIVFADYADADAVANGTYVVQPRDVQMYLVYLCGADTLTVCSRQLQAGEIIGKVN
jgi:hypothetical protein